MDNVPFRTEDIVCHIKETKSLCNTCRAIETTYKKHNQLVYALAFLRNFFHKFCHTETLIPENYNFVTCSWCQLKVNYYFKFTTNLSSEAKEHQTAVLQEPEGTQKSMFLMSSSAAPVDPSSATVLRTMVVV